MFNETKYWADVSARNFIIFLAALTGIGLDPEPVKAAMREILGRGVQLTRSGLQTPMVSLDEYKRVEDTLTEHLGHVYHLREEGRYSRFTDYGGSRAVQRFIGFLMGLGGLFLWLVSQRVGVRAIPKVSHGFVLNKFWRFLVDAFDHAILEVKYLPHDSARTPAEDQRSLKDHIVGVLQGIGMYWGWRCKKREVLLPTGKTITSRYGDVRILTLNMRPQDVLSLEAAGSRAVLNEDGELILHGPHFDDKPYGVLIYLKRDKTGAFIPDKDPKKWLLERPKEDDDTCPAIMIKRDVCTPCKRTGQMLPIMEAGVAFRTDKVRLANLVRLDWKANVVTRMVERLFLKKLRDRFHEDTEQEAELAEVRSEATSVRHHSEQLKAHIADRFPNRAVAQQVRRGQFQDGVLQTVIMQADLKGLTSRTSGMEPAAKAAWVNTLMMKGRAIIRDLHGWTYQQVGDCLVGVFAPGFHREEEFWTEDECAMAAFMTGSRFLTEAKALGWAARVGIHFDQVHWSVLGDLPEERRLEGIGDGLDIAARLEKIGSPGCVTASGALVKLLFPDLELVGARVGQTFQSGWLFEGVKELEGVGHHQVLSRSIVDPPTMEEVDEARRSISSMPAVQAVPVRGKPALALVSAARTRTGR